MIESVLLYLRSLLLNREEYTRNKISFSKKFIVTSNYRVHLIILDIFIYS